MAQTNSSDLCTKLSRVKGLGSAHHGVEHWWHQRMTAVAIIPLSIWFMGALLKAMLSPNPAKVADWFVSPVHAILLSLLIISAFVHARLGVQVVVEDYVKPPFAKYALLLANSFICVVGIVISLTAILKLHFLDITSATM